MNTYSNDIVKPFDFSTALSLSFTARVARSLELARNISVRNSYQKFSDFPCVPNSGASKSEIKKLESNLGYRLPEEYREFLLICRYLIIGDGCEIGGLDHEGLYVTERPWVSDQHRPKTKYLVFANYWRYADGDQLMFDLTDAANPVIAYLHEDGPLYELYAPTFSLALWRLVHEMDADQK